MTPVIKMKIILKRLHLSKKILVLLISYNFCNYNFFISLKIVEIFQMNKVIVLSYIFLVLLYFFNIVVWLCPFIKEMKKLGINNIYIDCLLD